MPYLDRRIDALGEGCLRHRRAMGALAGMGAMFGDHKRLRLRQVKHLPRNMGFRLLRRQRRTAVRAGRRMMIDNPVGLGDLTQRFALVPLLPARLAL